MPEQQEQNLQLFTCSLLYKEDEVHKINRKTNIIVLDIQITIIPMTENGINKIIFSEFKDDYEKIIKLILEDEEFEEICQDFEAVVKTIKYLQNQKMCDVIRIKEYREIQRDLKLKILAALSTRQ